MNKSYIAFPHIERVYEKYDKNMIKAREVRRGSKLIHLSFQFVQSIYSFAYSSAMDPCKLRVQLSLLSQSVYFESHNPDAETMLSPKPASRTLHIRSYGLCRGGGEGPLEHAHDHAQWSLLISSFLEVIINTE